MSVRHLSWRARWLVRAVWVSGAVLSVAATACAQSRDVVFSASVDKTTVVLGDPIQLTLTLSGDIAGAELPSVQLPEGFVVVGRSQSTNFALHAGSVEQSVSLLYVLLPQRIGTFDLGPFLVTHHQQQLRTSPITVTVKKSLLPLRPEPPGTRVTL